jgi:hypothetical protein
MNGMVSSIQQDSCVGAKGSTHDKGLAIRDVAPANKRLAEALGRSERLGCAVHRFIDAQAKGVAANREAADAFAANVLPIVRQIQASGVTTFRAIAAALNNRGVRTARGGAWHDSTVRNLLARAG